MKKFLPIIIILITSSCVVKEKDDTIIEFEELLTEHFESYKTDHREKLAKLGGGWVKKQYYFEGEYVYEAKKTSSTISPYEGICEFELICIYTDFHKTKKDAIRDNKFINKKQTKHRHEYLYHEGKWMVSKRENKGYYDWYDCNEIISSGENIGATNIHGCWEKNIPEL